MSRAKTGVKKTDKTISEEPYIYLLDDGSINPTYYYNASIDIIERTAQEQDIDLNKADTNRINYLLRICYKALYAPNKPLWTNKHSIIPYTPENIQRLIDIYLDITSRYNALPSIAGFQFYTGIDDNTVRRQEVTPASGIIGKARKNYVQNRLNNTPLGVLALANNDVETGLLYTRQNIVTHEAVRRSLSFDDLKRLADNSNN